MRLVPEEYRRRFFTQVDDAPTWRARPVLTDMLTFRRHNLVEPLDERPFDVVILKNVLIYFDAVSKAAAIDHVRAMVRPGGWLLTGAAEGVTDLLRDFQRLEPWLYRKPPADRMDGISNMRLDRRPDFQADGKRGST